MISKNSSKSSYLAEVKSKIWRFCAYRDRSIGETEIKLRTFDVQNHDIQLIIEDLIQEKFLDDSRFIERFCQSKLNNNWGRIKIKYALINKFKCNNTLIDTELNNINQDEYLKKLESVLRKKKQEKNYSDSFEDINKLKQYAASKGFETNLIIQIINTHF